MRFWVALLVCLLFAPAAWASIASTTTCATGIGVPSSTRWQTIICATLCDDILAADTACTEYDLGTVMPDLIVLERDDSDDCIDVGGPTITITTGPTTGGTPSFDIDTTAVVLNDATDRVVIDVSQAVLDRYLFTAIADATGCDADPAVDVRMYLLYHSEE